MSAVYPQSPHVANYYPYILDVVKRFGQLKQLGRTFSMADCGTAFTPVSGGPYSKDLVVNVTAWKTTPNLTAILDVVVTRDFHEVCYVWSVSATIIEFAAALQASMVLDDLADL